MFCARNMKGIHTSNTKPLFFKFHLLINIKNIEMKIKAMLILKLLDSQLLNSLNPVVTSSGFFF